MRKPHNSVYFRMLILVSILILSATVLRAQTTPDFSGQWQQDNDRCQPKRNGGITLHIEQHGPALTVETTIAHGSQNPRHAVQKYTTDGVVSISTGADGDEFHTSILSKGSSLFFSIEEHEDGRILLTKETWTLIENGVTLMRVRERANGEQQTLIYRRIAVTAAGSKSESQEVRDK